MGANFGIDLTPFVSAERVLHIEHPIGKAALLARLIERTVSHPAVTDPGAFTKAIYDREEVTSTGIGGYVAVPHARLPSIRSFVMSLAILPHGIDYDAQDGAPVRLAVMIAARDDNHPQYLQVLATVAQRLKRPGLLESVIAERQPNAILASFLA